MSSETMSARAAGVTDLRPICYMVMPFRKKKVDEPRPDGAPMEIDFDALWERAYMPAITALGYVPMRADFDPSSAIVKAMLERIAFADLVLADVTIGNGNCYYELGVRHVAKQTHCVLVAPTWVRPLFDIAQFASVRFTLTDGAIPNDEATAIRDWLVSKIPAVKESRTPYYELIDASLSDQGRRAAFRDFALQLSEFQACIKALRAIVDDGQRSNELDALVTSLPKSSLEIPEVAIDLVTLMRDLGDWKRTIAFIDSLPASVRGLAWIEEQYALVLGKDGSPELAIGRLETLVERAGATPERLGLIGGRYKQLWTSARQARLAADLPKPSKEEQLFLTRAIDSYSRGMDLDLNAYYCSSNLPSLLLARGLAGDAARALAIEQFVIAACERARTLGIADEFLRPTLLGAAFRAGDITKAEELATAIQAEGPSTWKLDTTLRDLRAAIDGTKNARKRQKLDAIHERLTHLIG